MSKIFKNIIAIDFGGTKIRTALFKNNRISKECEKLTYANKGKKIILKQLFSSIEEVKGNKKIHAIGIGSPGPLKDGKIINAPNLPFNNFDIKKTLQNKFKVKIVVENDANCAAIAEAKLGIKKKNFILLTLGTGIGGGIIINGQIYKGQGNAGELGHIIIDHGKDLESLTAGKFIIQESTRLFGKNMFLNELSKHKKARYLVSQIKNHLAEGLASLINVFDPEIIVLTGGFKNEGQKFVNDIKKLTYSKTINPSKPPIVWSKLKNPGLMGAYLIAK